jgi:L-lactate dehydrogenase complex protein LldG
MEKFVGRPYEIDMNDQVNNGAREAILRSIRSHLAASAPHDARELALHREIRAVEPCVDGTVEPVSLVDVFTQNLEAVNGHCIVAQSETEIAHALTRIISELQKTNLRAQRIAISDAPAVERLMHLTDLEIEELAITPNASDIFGFDVGITTAQAAIAETGTLVLDSADERHRLVSLVPPVHIGMVKASRIYGTLGEVLTLLRSGKEISPTVTFVTGPSRTADIELTLAIGVHGPQELYVIIH